MNDRGWRVGNGLAVAALVLAAVARLVGADGLHRPDVASSRWIAVGVVLLAYASLCLAVVLRSRGPRRIVDEGAILVVFATQTGFAEELATQAAASIAAAGHRVDLRPLSRVDAATLAATRVAFLVVATYGEGEPPDTSRRFARAMASAGSLASLRFGLLGLGDRSYANYCGFARRVETWLKDRGAEALFDPIEVDNGAADALAAWRDRLRPWTAGATVPASATPGFARWTLRERRLANAGSIGSPVFRVMFERPADAMPDWQAGDIAVVRLPDGQQREYSIASLPADRGLELLVRQARRPDGRIGFGAEWLTSTLSIGEATDLRVRANHGFRLEGVDAATPLILIGNGTGIAGLRAHLKARLAQGSTRNWLFFGERHAAVDNVYAEELEAWTRAGSLERISYAFSRDTLRRVHVQDRVLDERDAVAEWLALGAIVLVCGSATGMAVGVDAALKTLVGEVVLDDMAAEGRYRRDVY